MSYQQLIDIVGSYREEDLLENFCKYYNNKTISGLNYFEYKSATNTTAIITPNQVIHHEATCFLLEKKYSNSSINTVLSAGRDLKKFLDFLLIWDIDLADFRVNLKAVIKGFISHLRVIDKHKPSRAVCWSFLEKIPLHERAQNIKKLSVIGYNKHNFMVERMFEEYSLEAIGIAVSTALEYLDFLQRRTYRYQDIKLSILPVSSNKRRRIGRTECFDIKTLLELAHINTEELDNDISPLEEEVFTPEEVDLFMDAIGEVDYQNKLIFTMLKCFGLRRAELSNLMIESSSIPKDFYDWDFNDAVEYLKSNLKGDIEFSSQYSFWECKVIGREHSDPNKQNKTKNRKVRLFDSFMSSEEFAALLVSYLQERQFLIEQNGMKDHNYVFISNSNRSKTKPISGATIYTRYISIAEKSTIKERLMSFSPHFFRHFFATYLIREKKIDINDISDLLGHESVETTRKIYLHYLPQKEKEKVTSRARKISKTFKGEEL